MVENTPYTRPSTHTGDPVPPQERVRETTVVSSSNSNGVIAAVVLVILLGIAGFVFFGGDNTQVPEAAAPAVEDTMTAPADDAASPAPAPDMPAELNPATPSADPAAPAAPAAPANDG
ncbi:MAG: hypothetical protein ABJN75_01985 [Hoeflea sp.]|uniref:hypothetical protein n=1 Tax=Hoeflea sp. TaxID=1940281 RepID=UPI003296B27E